MFNNFKLYKNNSLFASILLVTYYTSSSIKYKPDDSPSYFGYGLIREIRHVTC